MKTDNVIINPFDFSSVVEKSKLEQVAKILTQTEGETSKEKVDEIFSIFMGIPKISNELKKFFTVGKAPIGEIYSEWVEAIGLVDVLAVEHQKVNWCFSVVAARVPREFYKEIGPEKATRIAGEAQGKKLNKNVHFMYGDSRVYSGPCSTGQKFMNIAYIFGYKENTGEYS